MNSFVFMLCCKKNNQPIKSRQINVKLVVPTKTHCQNVMIFFFSTFWAIELLPLERQLSPKCDPIPRSNTDLH